MKPPMFAAGLFLLMTACSGEESGPPLPKIDEPYVISAQNKAALKTDKDRRFFWKTATASCKVAMNGQRAIGVFDDYEVTDEQVSRYCECLVDEGSIDLTTPQLADGTVNRESGKCRRYYRAVQPSEIVSSGGS